MYVVPQLLGFGAEELTNLKCSTIQGYRVTSMSRYDLGILDEEKGLGLFPSFPGTILVFSPACSFQLIRIHSFQGLPFI